MARAWIINSKGFASKVKNCAHQIKDCEAKKQCPRCKYVISNKDVSTEWPGFPAGVKFDPSDAELLEHLSAKCGVGNSKEHMFINEFIPTLEGDSGICYTHPENLPGAKKDGSPIHFFHKTIKAYSTGQRKRRKIDNAEPFRWHKTGHTKAIKTGVLKGYKKIMVLYNCSRKGSKAEKTGWAMHQYHLGTNQEEKEGEYVVSKISFSQHEQAVKSEESSITESSLLQSSPRTPILIPPNAPIPEESPWFDDVIDEHINCTQVEHLVPEVSHVPQFSGLLEDNVVTHVPQTDNQLKDNMAHTTWFAGESQANDYYSLNELDDILLCNETYNSSITLQNGTISNPIPNTDSGVIANNSTPCGIHDLENLDFDIPDLQLTGLQFCSQDSVFDFVDRL